MGTRTVPSGRAVASIPGATWSSVDCSSVCGEVKLRATSSGSAGARGSRIYGVLAHRATTPRLRTTGSKSTRKEETSSDAPT
ncbi:hypothetical protein [Sorangium sp. So ce363]|uniref:hypothetical protein n=1 Tax=Sorangium sp. So ce363 TaxID=3133304 RepID=UPI003F60FBE7